jgi:acyl dehydratase
VDLGGTAYPPTVYAVGREKIVEFANATGETNPLHLELPAARAAGHADLVAPPMFAVVYQGRGIAPAMRDPVLEIDFPRLLHAGQDFRWAALAIAGDELTSTVSVASIRERSGMRFVDFAAETVNQRGELVVRGTWRNLIRPREES